MICEVFILSPTSLLEEDELRSASVTRDAGA
jgi:hypothetical protein